MRFFRWALRVRPSSTPCRSHQATICSRQSPESPGTRIVVSGQRWRICATIADNRCQLFHHHGAGQQRRVASAVAAFAPNTRRAYGSAWSDWERWVADHGRQVVLANAADVADHLEAPRGRRLTERTARAAVAKVHQVSGIAAPTADALRRDVLSGIGRDGRDRGRG